MSNALRDTYLNAVIRHRDKVANAVPPLTKADELAAGFTEWLTIAQFLHWSNKILGLKPDVCRAQHDFEYFRKIDPKSQRRVTWQVAGGKPHLWVHDNMRRPKVKLSFSSYEEWEETKEDLDEYRPDMDFDGIDLVLLQELKHDLELEIGLDIEKSGLSSE